MTVMSAVYGIDLTEGEEECFQMGETITRIGTEMFTPGAFPVDSIPVLRFLPSWFPGVKFKKIAAGWRAQSAAYRDRLYAMGLKSMVRVVSPSSPVSAT